MVNKSVGRRTWVIGDGYIPGWSNEPEPEILSHESAPMSNTGDTDANVTVTVFYEGQDPYGISQLPTTCWRAGRV